MRVCRSGRWQISTGCIDAQCAKRWIRRCRRRARPGRERRRGWSRSRRPSMRCCVRIWMPRKKQRHTARRVLARLVDEHDAAGLSYSTVRDHIRKRRPQIAAEAGRALEAGFVPQTYRPGAEAEVDFHDLWVMLAGVKTKTALFTMRLSFSGRAAHRAFATQGQEAFLEGHVYGFDRLGGVPVDKIRYDNLNSAVKQVLFGRSRQENERWIAFRSHYGFEAWYCQPGHDGSHEKGGVEGEGGRFRRNHCVPMPVVDSIDELNAFLAAADDADDRRRIANRANSVGQDWETERQFLQPVADQGFETALTLTPRVDRYAQIMVRCNQYSVPARFIGHRVRVKLSASHVTVYDRTTVVARHPRAVGKGTKVLDLDHYLEILARKPGALPGPPHWLKRGRPNCSPLNMTRGGPQPGGFMGMLAEPVCWLKSCCCTVTSTALMCWPVSALRCRWARSMPMWWRWKPAGPPNSAPASVRHPAAVRAPRCSGSLSTA
ncbi:IS21 family transposase [Mycobacterium avium]|uniref:IS21 family transposase n=1 Tax=Mycobacterium avium TaxID=1764 RepID=UPI001586B645|nr:IS21 family transposase [Mycobacterium avium]